MESGKILHFVAEKIRETRVALLYCYCSGTLKINNTIIHTINATDDGRISFFIRRPQQALSEFEQGFPVEMNYFKKGNDYRLKVLGRARIISDPEGLAYHTELSREEIYAALTTQVLIQVQVVKVDFCDNNFERKNLVLKKVQAWIARLFDSVGNASATYDLSGGHELHNYGF